MDFLLALVDDVAAKRSTSDGPAFTVIADPGEERWYITGAGSPARAARADSACRGIPHGSPARPGMATSDGSAVAGAAAMAVRIPHKGGTHEQNNIDVLVVVGGGISGLANAVALSRQGLQVRVLEHASRVW